MEGVDPKKDIIVMIEASECLTHVKHHKKKMVFMISAMRHFAKKLASNGYRVEYVTLDMCEGRVSLITELKRIITTFNATKLVFTQPSEYHVMTLLTEFTSKSGIEIECRLDDRFLCSIDEFKKWATGRKQLRMEFFYREMRKKHNILMDGAEPEGGQWNYDAENRKPPKNGMDIPLPYNQECDSITNDVIEYVTNHFVDHFGDIYPFYFAVTSEQAKKALLMFIDQRLSQFGDYQDAMIQGEPWMFHSHISFYLNCGLLTPKECVEAAQDAYLAKKAPLNAVEGFIRQILGWREYIRGIYWLKMPDYKSENYFSARRPLPSLYWDGKTKMNCLKQCVDETKHAYAHHIQRLMVLGNFALLTGIDPDEVNEWFWIVYADAYQWVELPNVTGMILYADGGYLASKPYAAGGSYINKMSNYCKSCSYKVSVKNGESACPFNYLYWQFLSKNRHLLSTNPRLSMVYRTYDKMSDEKKEGNSIRY